MAWRPDGVYPRAWLADGDLRTARAIVAALPDLPPALNYLDEYDDAVRTIPGPTSRNLWEGRADTRKLTLDFSRVLDESERMLLKHVAAWMLSQSAPITAFSSSRALINYSEALASN
jgi:hypothetical protein